ncbi:DUF6266 family protein [Pedobacter faecalis]|uniref:DUF6266 family protein n=1 Tax=Pedobacter faecalis TaxID=3041495 RepID=UPI00254DDF3A|nr:DUF6266 family protein [Pedobacter sp. ELA7]
MAIVNNGLLGTFFKKAGVVIGRRGKRRNVMTGLHKRSKAKATETQLEQQERFAELGRFLHRNADLIAAGFKSAAKGKEILGTAFSYNYPRVFKEDYLDYTRLVYSRGPVSMPCGVQVTRLADEGTGGMHKLRFTWAEQPQSPNCQYADRGTFLIYSPEKNAGVSSVHVVSRRACICDVLVPRYLAGVTLHCYMNFDSADGRRTGDTVYAGALIL